MKKVLPLTIGFAVLMIPTVLMAASLAQGQRIAERRARAELVVPTIACLKSEDWVTQKVDLQKVRETWLGWYNAERVKRGLPAYRLEPQLNRTAALWSARSATKGVMEHKRDGTTAYYDYGAIKKWFSNLGLEFRNIGGMTFTESIGRGPYTCKEADCTEKLLKAIRYSFDYYVSEEEKSYRPHYNAIVSPSFTMMGFGLAVKNGQYFVTAHFATEITSSPLGICAVSG